MRYPTFFFAILLPATCVGIVSAQTVAGVERHFHVPAAGREKAKVDSAVQFLLAASAADFHAHGPSHFIRVREVRVGHAMTPRGEKQYRLCGEFTSIHQEDTSRWIPFATMKTSGYEQWIGAQAAASCQDTTITWDDAGDLSSALQNRLNELR